MKSLSWLPVNDTQIKMLLILMHCRAKWKENMNSGERGLKKKVMWSFLEVTCWNNVLRLHHMANGNTEIWQGSLPAGSMIAMQIKFRSIHYMQKYLRKKVVKGEWHSQRATTFNCNYTTNCIQIVNDFMVLFIGKYL